MEVFGFLTMIKRGVKSLTLLEKCTKRAEEPGTSAMMRQITKKEIGIFLRECGTPFQRKVWRAIQKIPYGETRSYQWIAKKIGRPKAVRAVGQACGKNPLPLLIPCHRVVGSRGKIGGFTGAGSTGGLKLKRRLLKLEAR